MTPTVRLLVAGQPLDPASSPLPAGKWLVPHEDGSVPLPPGIASFAGQLVIVLPRCYTHVQLDPGQALASVALLVSSLARYARERARARQRAVDDPLQR